MIIYKNEINQEVILTSTNIKVIELEGITGLTNIINSSKGINQDGASYSNSFIEERDILLKLRIKADINNYRLIKRELYNAFNPKLEGELIIINPEGKKSITVRVVESPNFRNIYNKKECSISLIALDPYFKSELYSEEIATWYGGFSFKTKMPLKFRQKGDTKKNIINSGHVDTPVKIYFEGTAVNPSIINRTTGEYVKINKTINAGETLIINTEYGNKTVQIESGGTIINAFHYLDLDSSFFNLVPGDNLIEYTTENELDVQKVEIRYKERFLGV